MREFVNNWKTNVTATAAGAAMLAMVIMAGLASPVHAQKKRDYKDNLEYDAYNEVIKDINAKNFAKMVTDIEAWKTKYPESQYSDLRDVYYVQALAGSSKCSKALPIVDEMMAKDLDKLYPDPADVGQVVTVLYTTLGCLSQAQTPQELATIGKAAEMLKGYSRMPAGMTDATWAEPKKQLVAAANATLLNIALIPGNRAMAAQPPDCAAAEKAFTTALQTYPDNTLASYGLGRAWLCIGRANNQEKMKEYGPKAIYEFTRSAVVDPTLMGTNTDPKTVVNNATNMYKGFHGSEEGFDALKNAVKASALPPDGFKILTTFEVDDAKQKDFEGKYPELALWLKIKAPLSDTNGEQYFTSTLKDADIPKLKGTIVEGTPACRSKSLLVSFPEPNQQGTAPTVVTLKLDSPLTGKPEPGEIEFKGVPTAFKQQPFMLTLDTEKANITGLKTTPCAAAPVRAPAKKGVTKKK